MMRGFNHFRWLKAWAYTAQKTLLLYRLLLLVICVWALMACADSGSRLTDTIGDHKHIVLIHVDLGNIFLKFRWPLLVNIESLGRVHHISCGTDFFCPSCVHRWVNLTKLTIIVVGSALIAIGVYVDATEVSVSELGGCLKAHFRPLQFNLFVELDIKF